MDFRVEEVEKHGAMVKQHPEMDALRKEQCLCLHCDTIKSCSVAEELLSLCKENNMAMCITRCLFFGEGPKEGSGDETKVDLAAV